jgi:cytidine deaminase
MESNSGRHDDNGAANAGGPDLPAEVIDQLIATARAFAKRAYVPYSSFPVGAAVLTADGSILGGVNIENASYGLTVCGERVAIFGAAAAGHREIRAVAVSAPKASGATPCGACRQVMNEFKPGSADLMVILDDSDGPRLVRLGELLPDAFGPRDLDRE